MGKYLHQITELSETPANGDLILIQDVSDTTDSTNGTTKKVTYSNLTSGLGGGSGLSNVVEDTTPQLGGALDVNGKSIVSTSGANITIAPNGTGNVILGTMTFDADQSIGAGQDNYVLTYDNSTGLVSLEAAAGGGSGDITAVNITTDSGAGSKASDTSGDADFSLLGGDGISVTNSGATITVALADPDSDNGSDIDEGVIATSDRLLIWDETANSWKYVTVDNLQDELDTNTGIALTALSVGAEPSASGDGAIAYNNSTGVFTYTPPTAAGISAITVSSTDTLTNKTFDANGTGNSLSNVETADLASGSKTGADTKVVTGTVGTNGNLVSWNADGDAVDSSIVASNVALSNGDTYTGTHDFGGATLEIPNAAAPSMSVAGQIALDTTTTDHTALLKYHDGTNEFVIPAILTSGISTTDNDVIAYNAANNRFEMEAQTGSGGSGISNVVEDTTPQLGGHLDINGKAIGDGTRELLTFTEDGSAVNHINIENQATGSGPIISTAGDDSDVDLILSSKGTGNVTINKDLSATTASFSGQLDTAARTVINGTAPLGTLTIYGDNAADQALVIKAAASQSTSIWEVLESTGHRVFSVTTNYINTKSLLPLTTDTWNVGQWNLSYNKIFGKVLYTDPGTASAPSYNFHAGGDTLHNTGLFGTAAKLGISVGGVEKASATTSGLVAGLGASLGTLTVYCDSDDSDSDSDAVGLVIHASVGQTADILQVQNGAGANLVAIDSSGRLEVEGKTTIGGSTSLGTLTVYGDNAADEAVVIKTAGSQTANSFAIQDSAGAVHQSFGAVVSSGTYLTLGDGSTTLGASGSYLTYKSAWGDITQSVWGGQLKFAGLTILAVAGELHAKTKIGWSLSANGATQIELEKVADAHLALTGGDVSDACEFTIGGTTSLGTLTVYGHDDSDETVVIRAASGQAADILQIQNSGGTELFTIDDTGNVGINTAAPNAKLSVTGSMSLPIEAISATDTLDDTNHTILVNAAGGVKTVNLPAASGATGKIFIIKKTDSSSNNVTIDPNASETIDGSSTFAFNAQYRAVTIQCDGSNWHIISSYIVNY